MEKIYRKAYYDSNTYERRYIDLEKFVGLKDMPSFSNALSWDDSSFYKDFVVTEIPGEQTLVKLTYTKVHLHYQAIDYVENTKKTFFGKTKLTGYYTISKVLVSLVENTIEEYSTSVEFKEDTEYNKIIIKG